MDFNEFLNEDVMQLSETRLNSYFSFFSSSLLKNAVYPHLY